MGSNAEGSQKDSEGAETQLEGREVGRKLQGYVRNDPEDSALVNFERAPER